MYTLHFYSCTHGASLRAKGDAAIRAGLALFVTEWGASNADGGLDGRVCLPEAQSWIDWMKANGISWTAWKLDVGTDTTNLLQPGRAGDRWVEQLPARPRAVRGGEHEVSPAAP